MATVAELPGEWRRQAQDLNNMAFAAARGTSRDAVILNQCASELEAALAADADHRDALRFRKLADAMEHGDITGIRAMYAVTNQGVVVCGVETLHDIDDDRIGPGFYGPHDRMSKRIATVDIGTLADALAEPQTTEGGA